MGFMAGAAMIGPGKGQGLAGQHVVGQSMGQLGQKIGRGRGHHQASGRARRPEVVKDPLGGRKRLGIDRISAPGPGRTTGRQTCGGLGQGRADLHADGLQGTQKGKRLVGGHAAGDAEVGPLALIGDKTKVRVHTVPFGGGCPALSRRVFLYPKESAFTISLCLKKSPASGSWPDTGGA
jgi:hypothetical protein